MYEEDMFAIGVAKVVLLVKDRNVVVIYEFVVLVVSGRSMNVSRKCYPEIK